MLSQILWFIVPLLQFSQGAAPATPPARLSCRHPKSTICTLQDVNYVNFQEPLLPDLSKKHTLQVKSGSIKRFSKELASQLGDVERLQLARLDMEFLFISAKLVHLSADGNNIGEVATEMPGDSTESFALEHLNLMNNKLKNVKVLEHFVKLKELLLDGNELEFLEMEVFSGMVNLRKLSLGRNKLSQLTTASAIELPALEILALGSNELTKLSIGSWVMEHLTDLELSHNKLVNLDRENFDQFVSLEKLALAHNSWNCFWLNRALMNISQKYIDLTDRDEHCEAMPIRDICCSMTNNLVDQPEQTDLPERISKLTQQQSALREKLSQSITSLANDFQRDYSKVLSFVEQRESEAKKMEEMDDEESKITEDDVSKLDKDIVDLQQQLKDLQSLREQNSHFVSIYTNMKFQVISLKNRLQAEMKNVTQLQRDMEAFKHNFQLQV